MEQMDTTKSAPPLAWASLPALACATLLAAGGAWAAGSGGARLELLPQQWLDEQGQALALKDLIGQRVVLSMAYTQCHHTCPATLVQLQRMQSVLDARGEQASFVIIGYDSEDDNPAGWRQYRINRRLDRSNWHFLTGSHAAVRQLARQLGFEFWIYDEHVLHEPRIVVFDARGHQSATFTSATGDWLARL
jgi:cytochrome oxidase Cu insertion factor (SCO1/SenC/PrrC family)